MAAVKLLKFLGESPKISAELLPDGAAQIAFNAKTYSGDLIPYRTPKAVFSSGRSGEIKTLHALRNPSTGALVWLSWANDVDIVVASSTEDQEQRFYYSGDGAPKVSNYELATLSSPAPASFYLLGLPLPTQKPTASSSSPTTVSTATFSRDSGNIATITTGSAHNLKSGNIISITGFTALSGTYSQSGTTITVTITNHGLSVGNTIGLEFTTGASTSGTFTVATVPGANSFTVTAATSRTASGNVAFASGGFNATNVEVTVTGSTTITYFSPGAQFSSVSDTNGKVSLAGNTQARSYVYTWYTPWGEESIGSDPSTNVYVKEGQTVTVSNLPSSGPGGSYFVRGLRLYRTIASTSGTDYFRLKTLWFPNSITTVARSGSISTVTTNHHNFQVGDRFKISGCSSATFDITGGIVTEVVDQDTFRYAQSAANVASVAATGTIYYDVSETSTATARYWGDGSYSFTDDFDGSVLTELLITDDYDPPPVDLEGLTSVQNNILCGFVGNSLYFSEPGKPWAWPEKYKITLESEIVAVTAVSGYTLVMTKDYPYQVSGSNPASGLSINRIDTLYPCLSKRSAVNMGYGAVYATHGGLALYSPLSGADLITKLVHDWDTWAQQLDPSTIVGKFYNGKYFGSHSTGSFIFERDERIGGFFVQIRYRFTAAYQDTLTNTFYYIGDTSGTIYEWDNETQPLSPLEWKSKAIITKDYINLGAARVIADYDIPNSEKDVIDAYNATVPGYNTGIWAANTQLGTINGPLGVFGGLNSFELNGDPLTRDLLPYSDKFPVTFRLWANKELVFQGTILSSDIFRLPTGYRSDTFEVAVSGSARVRSIHIGETPFGLRTA